MPRGRHRIRPATRGKMFHRWFVVDGFLGALCSVFTLVSALWVFSNPERLVRTLGRSD